MATRGNTTFQKRQKEMARKDKQLRKVERRAERKLNQADSDQPGNVDSSSDMESRAQPEADDPNPFSGS